MATTNFQDPEQLAEIFRQMAESSQRYADVLASSTDDVEQAQRQQQSNLTAEERATLRRAKLYDKAVENHVATFKQLSSSLVNFSNSLAAAPGSFGPMKQAMGLVTDSASKLASQFGPLGKMAGGVISAFGEVAKFVTDQFEKAYGTFEKLTETGIVTTFEDMHRTGDALGLTFADTDRVLSKSGKELAMLGGSAITGRKEFEQLAVSSEGVRRDFQKLGIGAADFSEFQMSYVAQQQRYNRGQKKSVDELARGSTDYIKELDALSKLTGVSRKQLQSEQEARLRDVRYRAGIANLQETERKEIDKMLGTLKQFAPGVEEGMKDLIASGGRPITEAAKATMLTLQQGGLNVQEVVEGLRSGSIKGFDAFQKITAAAGKAGDATQELATITGDSTILTKYFVEMRELEARQSSMTEEEYNKLRKEIELTAEASEGQNAALANAKQASYNAGRNVEKLATSSEFATKAISMMADGIEWATEKMYEMAGKELPEHLKARREERKAIEDENKKKKEAAQLSTEIAALEEKQAKGELGWWEKIQLDRKKYDLEWKQSETEKAAAAKKAATEKRIKVEAEQGIVRPGEKVVPTTKEGKDVASAEEKQKIAEMKVAGYNDQLNSANKKLEEKKKELAEAEKQGKSEDIIKLKSEIENIGKEKSAISEQIIAAKKEKDDAVKTLNEAILNKLRAERNADLKKAGVTLVPADGAAEPKPPVTGAPISEDELKGAVSTAAPAAPVAASKPPVAGGAAPAAPVAEPKPPVAAPKPPVAGGAAPAAPVAEPKPPVAGGAAPAAPVAEPKPPVAEPKPPVAGGAAPAAPVAAPEGADKKVAATSKPKNVTIGQSADVSGVGSKFLQAFYSAATEYGQPISINSAYRDDEKQAELWVRGRILGDPGVHMPAAPKNDTTINYKDKEYNVKGSGKGSKHREGDALDISTNHAAFDPILAKYGMHRPFLQRDPPHVELKAKNGAVIQPTPGGSIVNLAEAGQAEAVVPLPDGRTIPVTIKNSGDQVEALRGLFEGMMGRMDTMIDLLDKGNRVQSNMLSNMA